MATIEPIDNHAGKDSEQEPRQPESRLDERDLAGRLGECDRDQRNRSENDAIGQVGQGHTLQVDIECLTQSFGLGTDFSYTEMRFVSSHLLSSPVE